MGSRALAWKFCAATMIAVVSCLVLFPSNSSADSAPISGVGKIPLGGGAGIVIGGGYCTLGAIGADSAGRIVGITAAHCAVSESVYAMDGVTQVGVFVSGDGALDYALIQFDESFVRPVANYAGLDIWRVGPDPEFGTIACKWGAATGADCGIVWGPDLRGRPHTILNQTCSRPGDSGAPVLVDGALVAINNGNQYFKYGDWELDVRCEDSTDKVHNPAYSTSITAILSHINSGGAIGAGFTLAP